MFPLSQAHYCLVLLGCSTYVIGVESALLSSQTLAVGVASGQRSQFKCKEVLSNLQRNEGQHDIRVEPNFSGGAKRS